jgi:signal transduction histidine kinase
MSLRLRLTLLYSLLTGGILFAFEVLLFVLVTGQQVRQVDNTLSMTVTDILGRIHVNQAGGLSFLTLPRLDVSTDVYIQVWGKDGVLQISSPAIAGLTDPLDTTELANNQPTFHDTYLEKVPLRVLTVPLVIEGRSIGTLQAGYIMAMIDTSRQQLIQLIIAIVVGATAFAALASWLTIGRALSPLAAMTSTALQITHADDLSRRIPLRGSGNDEVGRLVIAFNDTLERLEHLFASQQRFLADVSHELRTPLTVIKGNVNLMRKMSSSDEESLGEIEEEADRLTRLVGDLLLEAQVESGNLPLDMKPVELDTLLLEVFKEMRFLARDRVQLKLTEIDQISVNGDRDRLKQVLINLVSNGIQYTPQGGQVFLSLGKVGENARILVRDTGLGIPTEDLPHIFERFYRADKSRSRSKSGGFGLGLSIAYWIITNHGGKIEVDSREGEGTSFCIYLPLLENGDPPLGQAGSGSAPAY